MNEIERWAGGGSGRRWLASREDRELSNANDNLVRRARFEAKKAETQAAVAGRWMELGVDLIDYSRALAGDDPQKQLMVSQYLAGFGNAGIRSQRNLANEL